MIQTLAEYLTNKFVAESNTDVEELEEIKKEQDEIKDQKTKLEGLQTDVEDPLSPFWDSVKDPNDNAANFDTPEIRQKLQDEYGFTSEDAEKLCKSKQESDAVKDVIGSAKENANINIANREKDVADRIGKIRERLGANADADIDTIKKIIDAKAKESKEEEQRKIKECKESGMVSYIAQRWS